MTEDKGLTVFPNTLGVKLGSKWTVMYGIPVGEKPRKELTCIRKVPVHLIKKGGEVFEYSTNADPYANKVYPLIHGTPRNDAAVPLGLSCELLLEYANWLLRDIPRDVGIVFCLPMIKHKEGLFALKDTLQMLEHGKKIGVEFIGEAWAAALSAMPIRQALGKQVLSLNFGSSTLESVFFSGLDLIDQAVWTFGGSDIDRRLVNAFEQALRGATATESQARSIKERYDYGTNENLDVELTRRGALSQEVVKGDTIKEVVDLYIDEVSNRVRDFLDFARTRSTESRTAINAFQIEGEGYLALVGGMMNMPGFSEAVYKQLVETGGISKRVEMVSPADGVIAPAIGAWKAANLLEEERKEQKVANWSDIK